jgi:hypothetical protein
MPSINFDKKKEVEWADISVFYGGAEVVKLTGIEYTSSKEKVLLHAGGEKPIGVQSGNRTYAGTLKVLKGAVDTLNTVAVSAGGKDLLDLEADIVVTYRPIGVNRPIQVDTLIGVSITEFAKGMDQGATSMPVSMPFVYLDQK